MKRYTLDILEDDAGWMAGDVLEYEEDLDGNIILRRST